MTTTWDPDAYARDAAFVYRSSDDLVLELDPRPGERVLDLGCGTGEHVAAIAARGAHVVGLDASEAMIAAARRAHPGHDFVVGDGQALTYDGAFDAVFSNAALHWMTRADDVANGVFRALAPGGRFVLEIPEARNVRVAVEALDRAMREVVGRPFDRSRWYFPTLGEHASRLERAGLVVGRAYVFPRPSFVADRDGASGLHLWYRLFVNDVLDALGDAAAEVVAHAERHATSLRRDSGHALDYVRLRMHAGRPAASASTDGSAPS